MRGEPRQHERQPLARRDGERRDGGEVLAVHLDRCLQRDRVGSRDGDPRVVADDPPHPGHDRAVVEPDHELHADLDLAVEALDDPDDVGVTAARRHEVDDADAARVGVEVELVHERAVAVAPLHAAHAARGCEQPAALALVAEQGGEAGAGVEARDAEPVDRAVAAHERRRLEVAEEAVVLDPHRPNARASP